jgi:hypothetical protein
MVTTTLLRTSHFQHYSRPQVRSGLASGRIQYVPPDGEARGVAVLRFPKDEQLGAFQTQTGTLPYNKSTRIWRIQGAFP